jgi:hypothetical protein
MSSFRLFHLVTAMFLRRQRTLAPAGNTKIKHFLVLN